MVHLICPQPTSQKAKGEESCLEVDFLGAFLVYS
jgi:hypothetical protein